MFQDFLILKYTDSWYVFIKQIKMFVLHITKWCYKIEWYL